MYKFQTCALNFTNRKWNWRRCHFLLIFGSFIFKLYRIVLYLLHYIIRRYNIGLTQQLVHDKIQKVLKGLTGKH